MTKVSRQKTFIPRKLRHVFNGDARYRCAYGGRGSGKTMSFALMTAVRAYQLAHEGKTGVILCAREFMNSLEDSSLEEVKAAIRTVPALESFFEIGEKFIRTKDRRISFIFSGLRHNLDSLKSKAKILIAWVDEAESVSESAWQKLIPTVREDGSEIWVTWNPEREGSPTDKRFRQSPPDGLRIAELNHGDNPKFPKVLEMERISDRNRLDDATYRHIWEGAYLENSKSQVFADKYEIRDFRAEDDWDGPYQGVDFGFSQDPTAAVRCWVHDECLYVEHEAGRVGLELDDTADFIDGRIPDYGRFVIRADSARPESISYLKRHGFPRIAPVEKGKGSVEDGIAFLKSFKTIVIHERCSETVEEFRKYSYKVDRLSGDVLPDLVDKFNHYIDAIRYAVEPLMRNKRKVFNIR